MTTKRFFACLALILASALPAGASAPSLMSYQGRIKESGLPVTGTRSVAIVLCPAATGAGGCIGTGAQNVSVVNGLFRTTFTTPSPIAWETASWYLEVQVGGVAFTPRELLASAPYAIYASSASTLIPASGGDTVSMSANLQITGAGTGPALQVRGNAAFDGAGHLKITGSGAVAPAEGVGCGGGTVAGSDSVGRITIGGLVATANTCVLTFGTVWSPNPPVCHFTNETRYQPLSVTAADTLSVTFTTGGAAFTSGDVISYLCLSY